MMASETEYATLWGETAPLPAEALAPLTKSRETPLQQWEHESPESIARKREQRRERARELTRQRILAGNPLRAKHGPGPEGATCGGCVHHLDLEYHGKHYHKCERRKLTHGAGSDIRVRWPACVFYSPAPQDAK